jgi:flagellar biogenesis protein FliO
MRQQVLSGVLVVAALAAVSLRAETVRADDARAPVAASPSAAAPVDGDGGSPPSPAIEGGDVEPTKPPPPPPFDLDETAPALTASDVVQPMLKTVVALSIVLLLAWLTLHKGMGRLVERAQAGKRMRVVERVALDARRSLFLVEVDGVTLVVGGGDLVRLDGPPPPVGATDPAAVGVRGAAFEKVLATSQSRPSSSTPASSSSSEPA